MTEPKSVVFTPRADDLQLATQSFTWPFAARVSLWDVEAGDDWIKGATTLWMDPAIDGASLAENTMAKGYGEFLRRQRGADRVLTGNFTTAPSARVAGEFVGGLMDACRSKSPGWISVPQMPHPRAASVSRFNTSLARAAGRWRASSGFGGHLVLPVIIQHQSHMISKPARARLIKAVVANATVSGAEFVWVTDASLVDDAGVRPLAVKRFPALLNFHEELAAALQDVKAKVIAGPYWAANLVLWARGLADLPAMGVGSGYQYAVAGLQPRRAANVRLMIQPLRRRVVAVPTLRSWLDKAALVAGVPTPLSELAASFESLQDRTLARRQVVKTYSEWVAPLITKDAVTRRDALFDDLSTAVRSARKLDALPDGAATTSDSHRPECVAAQLRDIC